MVLPLATLTPQERQQALRSGRAERRPLRSSLGNDLVEMGKADAQRLAGSRWHVVARALLESRELLDDSRRRGVVADSGWARASLVDLLRSIPDVGLESDIQRQAVPPEMAGGVGGGALGGESS